jgi:hypothetical protein
MGMPPANRVLCTHIYTSQEYLVCAALLSTHTKYVLDNTSAGRTLHAHALYLCHLLHIYIAACRGWDTNQLLGH